MKKEAITHGILEDLANRNENWDKLDGVPEKVTELDESRLILKNEIVNGDFSDGLSGWTVGSAGLNAIASDNILTFTGLGNPTSSSNNSVRKNIAEGTGKLYYRAVVKSSQAGNNFYLGGRYTSNLHNVSTSFSNVSFVVENPHQSFYEMGAVSGITVDVKQCLAVNLTQLFGAGNEPTKEEMDILMDIIGYFNGTHTITSKEQFNILLKMVRENALATASLGGGF